MAKLRKVESQSEARRLLARVEGSGLPQKEWAQAHGVDGRSLNAWRTNLPRRKRGGGRVEAPAPMQLVELVPAETSAPSARYEARVGVASVEFGNDFETETLRRVVEVLRSCCASRRRCGCSWRSSRGPRLHREVTRGAPPCAINESTGQPMRVLDLGQSRSDASARKIVGVRPVGHPAIRGGSCCRYGRCPGD